MTITSPLLQLFLIYIFLWILAISCGCGTFKSEEPNISVAEEEFQFSGFPFKALLNITSRDFIDSSIQLFFVLCLAYMAGQIIECMLHLEEKATSSNFKK